MKIDRWKRLLKDWTYCLNPVFKLKVDIKFTDRLQCLQSWENFFTNVVKTDLAILFS